MGELALDNTMSSTALDITTGGILGIVSSPTFNAEKLSQKISQEEWSAIIKDPRNPMFNRAYQAQYAPGSTFKIIWRWKRSNQDIFTEKQHSITACYHLRKIMT